MSIATSAIMMIAMVVTGFQPIHVAAFATATFVVLLRAITMEEAYRAVEWKAVFLVAAILPVGIAIERTGAAWITFTATHQGFYWPGPNQAIDRIDTVEELATRSNNARTGGRERVLPGLETGREDDVVAKYGVRVIGRSEDIKERFYAISAERRIKHPAVSAITETARTELFISS